MSFQTHHLVTFSCPGSFLFEILWGNFCPLLLQVSLEVVMDHMTMFWTQQMDTSRTHLRLEGLYIAFLGTLAAWHLKRLAADTKGCHNPEDKKVEQTPARQASEPPWERRQTRCHCRSILLLKMKSSLK